MAIMTICFLTTSILRSYSSLHGQNQVCVSENSNLRYVECKFASKESSLGFVEFNFSFRGIQVCALWNKVCIDRIKFL